MISNEVDIIINRAIEKFDFSFTLGDNNFRDLLSLGELIDRLAIVNFKLFMLKERQVNSGSVDVLAKAAQEDVRLVEERARLKTCIDEKVLSYIYNPNKFNAEVKNYGNM